jgi:hypothetical protein
MFKKLTQKFRLKTKHLFPKIEVLANHVHKFFTWKNLLTISELSVINVANVATVSVPIVAGILIGIEKAFDVDLSLPSQLSILYFTGLLFLIAKTLVVIFCPEIIKSHRTMEDFAAEKARIMNERLARLGQPPEHYQGEEFATLVQANLEYLNKENEWDHYRMWNSSNRNPMNSKMRKVIGYLFIVGGLLAFIYYVLIQGAKVIIALF